MPRTSKKLFCLLQPTSHKSPIGLYGGFVAVKNVYFSGVFLRFKVISLSIFRTGHKDKILSVDGNQLVEQICGCLDGGSDDSVHRVLDNCDLWEWTQVSPEDGRSSKGQTTYLISFMNITVCKTIFLPSIVFHIT